MRGVDREYEVLVVMGRLGALYPFAGRSAAVQVLSRRMKTQRNHVRVTGSKHLARRKLLLFYELKH